MRRVREYVLDRLGFALAGLLGIALLAVLAAFAQAGPIGPPPGLDPPAGPSPTDGVRLPGTPISSAPFPINASGHYYLTRNLTVAGVTAIQVNVADVSIDLRGFTLSGSDTLAAEGIEVTFAGAARLTVTNGTISDFDRGILAAGDDNKVSGVTLVSNRVGVSIGTGGVVSDCLVSQNVDGIIMTGAFAEVRGCNVSANSGRGILMNDSIETGLIERTSLFHNNISNSFQGVSMRGGKRTLRDSVLNVSAGRDASVIGYDHIIIDNVINCPTSLLTLGSTNTYAPVNVADPHTNRAQKAAC